MEIVREGKEKSVYWEGTCVRCDAIVRWDYNEIQWEDIQRKPVELEQDEKFPYKLKVSPSYSVIIEKDCPCCGTKKGIVVTRKTDLPGVAR